MLHQLSKARTNLADERHRQGYGLVMCASTDRLHIKLLGRAPKPGLCKQLYKTEERKRNHIRSSRGLSRGLRGATHPKDSHAGGQAGRYLYILQLVRVPARIPAPLPSPCQT